MFAATLCCRKPFRRPLSRAYFAVAAPGSSGEQFHYFTCLVSVAENILSTTWNVADWSIVGTVPLSAQVSLQQHQIAMSGTL